MRIQPVREEIGFKLVTGLTRSALADEAIQQELRHLWIEHGMLIVRGLDGGGEGHAELSAIFGPPEPHPFRERLVEGHPQLLWVRHIPGQEVVYDVDGELKGGWLPWHSDLAYMARINRGGVLRAIELPDAGGQTGFIDQIAAYQRLPQRLRDRIDGLNVVYTLNLNAAEQRFGRYPGLGRRQHVSDSVRAIEARASSDFPAVVHPLVYVQAETGRKVLNLSPWFADHVLELPGEEGDALLHKTVQYCVDDDHAYFHSWQPGDMVVWDNWRVLHCATGIAPDAVRRMQRTTLAGDYALGRVLDEGEQHHAAILHGHDQGASPMAGSVITG